MKIFLTLANVTSRVKDEVVNWMTVMRVLRSLGSKDDFNLDFYCDRDVYQDTLTQADLVTIKKGVGCE